MHKHDDDSNWNMLNYLADFLPESRFLGFQKLEAESAFIGHKGYCAVHLFKCERKFGESPLETQAMIAEKPWVLVFYGVDYTSVFNRFATDTEARAYYLGLGELDVDGHMYFNS